MRQIIRQIWNKKSDPHYCHHRLYGTAWSFRYTAGEHRLPAISCLLRNEHRLPDIGPTTGHRKSVIRCFSTQRESHKTLHFLQET